MDPVILAPPAAITKAWAHTNQADKHTKTDPNPLEETGFCEKLAAPPTDLCVSERGCAGI